MNTTQNYFTVMGNLFLLLFLFTWWFKLMLIVIGSISAIIFYLVKISHYKNAQANLESQLLERNELLLYANKNIQKGNDKVILAEQHKTRLLSKINHEIRTPMNGVLGMASLLNETKLTDEQHEYSNEIIHSGQSLLQVINDIIMDDILEYSKIESGKELETKEVDLSNCIEDVLDVFASKAGKAGIDLLYNIEENVPQQIIGDPLRLKQVLMNFVGNSIKVTTRGEVVISVQLIKCKEDNQLKLEFKVSDTGTGISAEKIAALSKTFLLQNTAQPVNTTAGVGLIICKKLVALMGGSITVESTVNEGTTFTFTILSKAGMQPLSKRRHAEIADLENKKVLIVDDNITAADLLKKSLEKMNMLTYSSTAAEEAMEILTQVSFDLVITDMDMPVTNGCKLAESIKQKYPELPVILLNTINDSGYEQHPGVFGAIVSKPIKSGLLLDAILSQLRTHENSSARKNQTINKLTVDFSKQYPLKILVAEDNPVNQKLITKILSNLGYQTVVVNNGKEVLEVVSNNQFDLILMDIQMPEMDGLEASRMIRTCLDAQPIIIAMTANVMQGDRQACLQSGMDDYISKPVQLNDLISMLEKWALLIKEKAQFPLP